MSNRKRTRKPKPVIPEHDGIVKVTRSRIITRAGLEYMWYETEDGEIKQKMPLDPTVRQLMGYRFTMYCYYLLDGSELQLVGEPEEQSYEW